MKFILKNTKLTFLALLISFSFGSCNKDDLFDPGGQRVVVTPEPEAPVETNTIVDFVNNNDDYSSLAAALEAADLVETLDGDTNYTVFAPNNAAFDAFLEANNMASLDEVPVDLLTQVLLNHVQEGEIMSTNLSTGYINSMATGSASEEPLSLYINTDEGVSLNGVSNVTTADVEVDNGVIHAVDAVIGLPDVTTFATADPNFSILVAALTREDDFGYVSTLQSTETPPAPFTIFAPTDTAFADLLAELELSGLNDIPSDLLAKVLEYHVVAGSNVTSDALTDEMEVTTLQGGTFTIYFGENVTIVDENNRTTTIGMTDVQSTNGVIHAIDRVLLPADDIFIPENNIADFVANNENYSSLFAALRATGLTSVLDGEDDFTVFAPDNDAFAAFLDANGFDALEDVPNDVLKLVLMNHVQMGNILSTDLSTGYIPSMAEAGPDGEAVSLYVNTDGGVILNGASTVTTADVEVDNGVIHAVDAVIGLPDITTFALADPRFETLVAALTREDDYTFVSTLQLTDSPDPFTVFAPVNDAFGNLLEELPISELGDLDAATLAEVLSYHVITGANVRAEDLTDGMSVETFSGENVTVNVGDKVTVTDVNARTSTVIIANVQATNGVIHAIDQVLLPTL